jgi:hypothetical protein
VERTLYAWAEELAAALGLEGDAAWTGERDTVTAVLDLARESAVRVARPAAPVTAFLVGVAVGRAGATSPEDLERARAALAAALEPPAPT